MSNILLVVVLIVASVAWEAEGSTLSHHRRGEMLTRGVSNPGGSPGGAPTAKPTGKAAGKAAGKGKHDHTLHPTFSPTRGQGTNIPTPSTTPSPPPLSGGTTAPGTPITTPLPDGTIAPGIPTTTPLPGGTTAPVTPATTPLPGGTIAPGTPTTTPLPDSTIAPGTPTTTLLPGGTIAPGIPTTTPLPGGNTAPGTPTAVLSSKPSDGQSSSVETPPEENDESSAAPSSEPSSTLGDIDGSEGNDAGMGDPTIGSSSDPDGVLESDESDDDPTSGSTAGPTTGTVELSNTAIFCEGLSHERKEEVSWTYSMELNDPIADALDANASIQLLEHQLRSELQDNLLACDTPVRRKLSKVFGISALDYQPEDVLLEEECNPPKSNCFVYRGLMDIYLTEDAEETVAVLETRRAIRDLMSETDGLSFTGVKSVEYLAPELSDTSAAEVDSVKSINAQSSESLDSGLAVLVAVGCFFLVIAMFSAYRYKRSEGGKDGDALTLTAGSQVTGVGSNLSGSSAPLSPFSEMLPNAYRLNEPDTMSAILEDNSDSASQARSSDIVVSECGYTEEDSRDQSYMQGLENDPILGAQKMEDYNETEDFLYDTGSLAASIPSFTESSPTPKEVAEKENAEFAA